MFNKIFRRTLAVSALFIGASVLSAPVAKAVTDSDTMTGTLPAINTVDYVGNNSLTLSPSGHTNENFGSVAIQSNSANGWTLKVKSANGGSLVNGSYNIPYTNLTVNGQAADVTAAGANTDVTVIDNTGSVVCASSTACTGGNAYAVRANIASADIDGKPALTYTDTLTFTLTAQ